MLTEGANDFLSFCRFKSATCGFIHQFYVAWFFCFLKFVKEKTHTLRLVSGLYLFIISKAYLTSQLLLFV